MTRHVTFFSWLLSQTGRKDEIGNLSRRVEFDEAAPTSSHGLRQYLLALEPRELVNAAWVQWQREADR